MKQINAKVKKSGYPSDDDNVRYKINKEYFNNISKQEVKNVKKRNSLNIDDDNVRYKFPTSPTPLKSKLIEKKTKPKPKIKVNFWSSKQTVNRINKSDARKQTSNRRHTVGGGIDEVAKKPDPSSVKVCKRVSFLPSPLFLDNHIPMVTVPDDLTIQLNEEEANDLGEDLNLAFMNSQIEENKSNDNSKRKARSSTTQTSPKAKRKRSLDDSNIQSHGNDYELEFFSKYVVQKLRRMETNQRIYSENLINTVLMLGQLGKLNAKSKITEV